MAWQTNMLAASGTIRDLPSFQQRSTKHWGEDHEEENHTYPGQPSFARPWSPGRQIGNRSPVPNPGTRSSARVRYDAWDEDGNSRPLQSEERTKSGNLGPSPFRVELEAALKPRDIATQNKLNLDRFSERREELNDLALEHNLSSLNEGKQIQRQNEEHSLSVYHATASDKDYNVNQTLRPNDQANLPIHDFHESRAADTRQWSQRRNRQYSPEAHEFESPTSVDGQLTSRPEAESSSSPDSRNNRELVTGFQTGLLSSDTKNKRRSFRTIEDESKAQDILLANKEAKIERRSSLRRFITPKSKRTSFSQREIFRAIQSVINGYERAGAGVVEVLLEKFVREGGNINFIPDQSKPLGIPLKRRAQERSALLEKATNTRNVEAVLLFSQYSDEIAKHSSLKIALHNRNTTTSRSIIPDDQMISILISEGANVDNTIDTATAAGDETLLHMLLEGNPPVDALSNALSIAVATRDIPLRRRLSQILLRKGADVNYSAGESVLHATKLFDVFLMDLLLEHRPHASSLSRAFAAALSHSDPSHRFEACQKLIDAGATGEQVNKGLEVALTTEFQNIDFLKLVLRSASVDFENGHALCQAVASNSQEHLKLMLANRPNDQTFDNALDAALRLRNTSNQFKFCHLLVGAGPPQKSRSKALVTAVASQKPELCRMFLEARASVDYDGGASITAAARAENIGILELLIGGEFQQPNPASLVDAFELSLLASPSVKKMKILRLILEAGLRGRVLDVALINAAKKGQEEMTMCELLLKYGASVNAEDGEALDICTRSGNLALLGKLLQSSHRPSSSILSRVFETALNLGQEGRLRAIELILQAGKPIDDQVAAALDGLVQERRIDMQAIELLLSFHASVHYAGHRPLFTAARSLNKALLVLLFENSRDRSAASQVFEALMKDESFWNEPEAFLILSLLIDNGARGIAVDDALIKAVGDSQPTARHFGITLLQHSNIDHKDGAALQIATERGESNLLRRMLAMKPSPESMSMAFPYAFVSKLPESTCVAVIDSFVELTSEDLYPDHMHPEIPEPPVFLCLKWYPHSLRVLEATLNAGFHVDQEMSSENGNLTALYWSLAEGRNVENNLVEFLIHRGAKLDNHPEPLLHLAIENDRHSVVQALVKSGADIDWADEAGVSPLSLATKKNDIETMRVLLAAKALSNDGSLHEAARMVNVDAINLLLANGHDPNYPSPRFEGRPPLFELCFQAPIHLLKTQYSTQQKESLSKKAIESLIKGGALTKDRLPQAGNRSVLIHALDSATPHMMTKAFLECGQFKHINKDFNLFMDGKYTYSPTMYIDKGKRRGDNSQSQSLMKILKDFKAKDRFWKITGPQPPDMINPPEQIKKAEDERLEAERRKKQEEEEIRREIDKQQRELAAARRKLALEQEAEQAKLDRENRAFQLRQAHDAKLHASAIAKENDRSRIQNERNAHALKQAASLSQLRDREDEARHRRSLTLVKEKKMLAQSQEALYFAYNKGMEDATTPGARRALGPSTSKSNLDLAGKAARLRIEGAFPNRIEEVDE